MAEVSLRKYKNLLGDTKEIIDAIQKYIKNNQPVSNFDMEEEPAASVNRVLNCVASEEINNDIRKIIKNL